MGRSKACHKCLCTFFPSSCDVCYVHLSSCVSWARAAFMAEIIGLHIPEASFFFLGPLKQLRYLQLHCTALLISL